MDKDTRTIIDLLNAVKEDICMNYCKYAEECMEAMETDGDMRPCPLDIIGG